ncbi:MAG: MFS transporter [Deltaproteobacteria bacterium]|nr:MFS transporter [Deltaproteobacteria bacterium]
MHNGKVTLRQKIAPQAGLAGSVAAAVVVSSIFLGSSNLSHFDWALLPYALATIFSAAALTYRCAVWLQRPPTKRYWQQGWRLFWQGGVIHNSLYLTRLVIDNFAAQRFIARRSRQRWLMHLCLSWGSLLAFAVTFPLVFGWVHFETSAADLHTYQLFVFGVKLQEFSVDSVQALLFFNALNLSAVLVLVGIALALHRRLTEPEALALQQFSQDLLPLLLLFAVAVTGLGLTLNARWLHGQGFGFLALTHAAAVSALLLYLPFGKLFHIFQRPAHLGVGLYKQAAQAGPPAQCVRCHQAFASQMQVEDLKRVLSELEFDYRCNGPVLHYQHVCPPCRRKLLALNQGKNFPGVGVWGSGAGSTDDSGLLVSNAGPRPLTPDPQVEG